jgi:hypothetical protein
VPPVADDAETREFDNDFLLEEQSPTESVPVAPVAPASPPRMPPAAPMGAEWGVAPVPVPVAADRETTVPSNIYRARRPAAAVLLVLPAIFFGLLLVRALAIAAFGKTFVLSGVIASSLALAALPLIVSGLYGLITGAAYGAEQYGFKVWARPPLAYLLVGLALVASAGFAVR